jgi:membrane protease YdiL (CAAX protease family)
MSDKQRLFKLHGESSLYQLFVSLMIFMGVGITLSVILVPAGMLIFGSDLSVLEKSATALTNNDVAFMRYLLIIQDISLLFVPSIIILWLMKPESAAGLPGLKMPQLKEIGLVVIMTFCIFPVTSFTGQINSAIHLPGWLSGVEHWMIEKEDKADNLINMFITSNTFWVMILNLLTIALIPAIAEELIFRGVFQKIFNNLFKSGHIAIWFTAFIFSTMHFQFFGFIPRFILGLVFGYLFFWGGTLWLPVISHFINNAFPVILEYMQGKEKINAPTDTTLLKQAIALPLPIVIILVILFYFRNRSKDYDNVKLNEGPASETD